jgi:hypothetical protein
MFKSKRLENAKLASMPVPVVMKPQVEGKLAFKFITFGDTSVIVTVLTARVLHGFEHSSDVWTNVKVAALPLAAAPTIRARTHPAARAALSFDFMMLPLSRDHRIRNQHSDESRRAKAIRQS